ncbi:hypothetical protein DFQ14_11060 [Halopolyspora algeriensis]|uniref:Helix-turn-helix protein n=1 Tax=Halopolyspora algeriensis TaxID=1500506 RepID=A0A368VHT2_9ACTN|nr:hypothetical protein [Halopolyspora algeriensis]RCW40734.1 hypothetical protein DFQ14_11060 [Halopolyspora algeriensis]TQM53347.1 hypothetical protein FHU43_2739 [Halopolyspora algeriensis]
MARKSNAQSAREYRARKRARNPPLRRPGENVHRAGQPWRVLSDEQVRDIRERLAGPDAPTQAVLAREYGIHPSTVCQIARGRRRKGVT